MNRKGWVNESWGVVVVDCKWPAAVWPI